MRFMLPSSARRVAAFQHNEDLVFATDEVALQLDQFNLKEVQLGVVVLSCDGALRLRRCRAGLVRHGRQDRDICNRVAPVPAVTVLEVLVAHERALAG